MNHVKMNLIGSLFSFAQLVMFLSVGPKAGYSDI